MMADSNQPSGHDPNRRGSFPGRQRDRGFPPDRPVPPSRSFSNMDPRRPTHNAGAQDNRKRNASKSPDGGHTRKQQKQDAQQNGAATNSPIDSRRSSASTNAPNARPPYSGAQSPGPQRPPVPTNPARRTNDAAALSSPRSPRESVASGRSTPQQRPTTLSKEIPASSSNGTLTSNSVSAVEPHSLMDLLLKFSSKAATCAALEHEKNEAEARLLNAQREYNEMKRHFNQFPSFKERKGAEKDIAHEAFIAKEKMLKAHTSSQTFAVAALASLLEQLATPKPSPDVVSRAEYESLQNDFLALKQDMAAMKQFRSDLDGVKTTADEAMSRTTKLPLLQQKVELMNKENAAIKDWKQGVESRAEQQMKTMEIRSNAIQKDLDEFKANDFKAKEGHKLAIKQQITSLETRIEPLSQKIEGLQKALAKLTADNISAQALAKSQAVKSISNESLQDILQTQDTLKHEVDNLAVVGGEIKGMVEHTTRQQETMTAQIKQLEADIDYCKDSIEEEGKEVIVKRVKNLDMLVNNLSSKIENTGNASINQRLSRLENGNPQQSKFQSTTGSATATAAVDLSPLVTRISKVEDELSQLESNQDEKDALLIAHVDNVKGSLQGELAKEMTALLSAARGEDQRKVDDAIENVRTGHEALQTVVSALQVTMRSKVDSASQANLHNAVSQISMEFKKIQADHQRRKSTTPAAQAPPADSPRSAHPPHQLPPHPTPPLQQLTNGAMGSPQVNGLQQSHSPRVMQHGHGQGIMPHAQKIDEMQQQINGLVAVTQQLKMRCDNLQTDDIVRSMVDQFNICYPDVRNINVTMQGLRKTLHEVQQQLSILQQQKGAPSEQSSKEIEKADAKAEGASKTAHAAFQEAQKFWSEINKIREAITALEDAAKKGYSVKGAASNDGSLKDDVNALRDDLDSATDLARNADRLSRQHASRLSKMAPETLQNRIMAVEGQVDKHEDKIRKGEAALEAFKEFSSDATFAKATANRTAENLGKLETRVEKLERGTGNDD